jgi:hypothetical protein
MSIDPRGGTGIKNPMSSDWSAEHAEFNLLREVGKTDKPVVLKETTQLKRMDNGGDTYFQWKSPVIIANAYQDF